MSTEGIPAMNPQTTSRDERSAYRDLSDEALMRAHAEIGDELERRYREAKRKQSCAARGFTLGGQVDGTSLQGYMTASYADLVTVLGEPNEKSDEYKVSTEWVITLADGRAVTIYDYKETNLYDDELPSVEEFRARDEYDWHIDNLAMEVQKLLFSSDTGVKR